MKSIIYNKESKSFSVKDDKYSVVRIYDPSALSQFKILKESTRLSKVAEFDNKPRLGIVGKKIRDSYANPVAGPFNTKDEAKEAKVRLKVQYKRNLLSSEKHIAKKLGLIK